MSVEIVRCPKLASLGRLTEPDFESRPRLRQADTKSLKWKRRVELHLDIAPYILGEVRNTMRAWSLLASITAFRR